MKRIHVMLPICPYLQYCNRFMKDYCEDRDARECFTFQEYRRKEIRLQRQKEDEVFQIEMNDIGQLMNIKGIALLLAKEDWKREMFG
jgi:hypothetical protein